MSAKKNKDKNAPNYELLIRAFTSREFSNPTKKSVRLGHSAPNIYCGLRIKGYYLPTEFIPRSAYEKASHDMHRSDNRRKNGIFDNFPTDVPRYLTQNEVRHLNYVIELTGPEAHKVVFADEDKPYEGTLRELAQAIKDEFEVIITSTSRIEDATVAA